MTLWIKDPLAIFAEGARRGLVIDGAGIAELVPAGADPATPVDEIFDAGEHVVLPGLINTHHHFYQTLTRAHPDALGKELFDWLKALYPIWSRLTPERLHVASRLAIAELLLSGCTTTADHHYVFPPGLDDAIDIEVEVAREFGIRIVVTRGSMDLSVADGGLPPDSVVQKPDRILRDSERLIGAYHQAEAGSHVQVALAPCSPFSVSRPLLEDTAALARRTGVRLHTHLAETEDENLFCVEKLGCRPLDYLESTGWLHDGVWLAHGIHFTGDEITRLGRAGVSIAHCPGSNMLLASGMCPTLDLEEAGCAVGIGVDGSASADASNMVQEVRHAFQLQRLRFGASRVGHADSLRWATEGSARCLGRDDIGVIEAGRQADLALFKLDDLRFSGAGDPLAALVLCGAHQADSVMIGGRWVVEGGAIPGLDLAALMQAHQEAAQGMMDAP